MECEFPTVNSKSEEIIEIFKNTKTIAKHIKTYTMKKRVNSHIKTIEIIEKIEKEENQNL
jgi:hypothetical protein